MDRQAFSCEICGIGLGLNDNYSLTRINPVGEEGIFRCDKHLKVVGMAVEGLNYPSTLPFRLKF